MRTEIIARCFPAVEVNRHSAYGPTLAMPKSAGVVADQPAVEAAKIGAKVASPWPWPLQASSLRSNLKER